MSKRQYSRDEKILIAETYLFTSLNGKEVAQKFHMPAKYADIQVYRWAKEYTELGKENAFTKRRGPKTNTAASSSSICRTADQKAADVSERAESTAADKTESLLSSAEKKFEAMPLNDAKASETEEKNSESVSGTVNYRSALDYVKNSKLHKILSDPNFQLPDDFRLTPPGADELFEKTFLNRADPIIRACQREAESTYGARSNRPVLKRAGRRNGESRAGTQQPLKRRHSSFLYPEESLSGLSRSPSAAPYNQGKEGKRMYSAEQKNQVILDLINNVSAQESAIKNKVKINSVYQWRRDYKREHPQKFEIVDVNPPGTKNSLADRFPQLTAQGSELQDEKGYLKVDSELLDSLLSTQRELQACKTREEEQNERIEQLMEEVERLKQDKADQDRLLKEAQEEARKLVYVLEAQKKTLSKLQPLLYPSQRREGHIWNGFGV